MANNSIYVIGDRSVACAYTFRKYVDFIGNRTITISPILLYGDDTDYKFKWELVSGESSGLTISDYNSRNLQYFNAIPTGIITDRIFRFHYGIGTKFESYIDVKILGTPQDTMYMSTSTTSDTSSIGLYTLSIQIIDLRNNTYVFTLSPIDYRAASLQYYTGTYWKHIGAFDKYGYYRLTDTTIQAGKFRALVMDKYRIVTPTNILDTILYKYNSGYIEDFNTYIYMPNNYLLLDTFAVKILSKVDRSGNDYFYFPIKNIKEPVIDTYVFNKRTKVDRSGDDTFHLPKHTPMDKQISNFNVIAWTHIVIG